MSELEIYQRNEGIRPVITGYLRVCNVCVCVCYRQGEKEMTELTNWIVLIQCYSH